MTVLTRIRLDSASRDLMRAVSDPVELHRKVMAGFGQVSGASAREALGVLWRYEFNSARRPTLTVQSNGEGDWAPFDPWAESIDSKDIDPMLAAIHQGQTLRVLLRANATRKINTKTGADEVRRNGQRVPLRSPEQAQEWLVRHSEAAGFGMVEGRGAPAVDIRSEAPSRGGRGGRAVTIEATRFEGLLTVTDPARLANAVRTGVGPAKAFGCGLLSLAPGPPA